jgi:hypothetical protein
MRPMIAASRWFRLSPLACALVCAGVPAQGGDPGGAVFACVQSGPPGCPAAGAPQEPSLDPAFFPSCWLPPSQCPPLQANADGGTPIPLPFRDVPPGAPCLLVSSPIGAPPFLLPCFHAGHDVLGLVAAADPTGRAIVRVRTPAIVLPAFGVWPIAQAQLYALDPSWTVTPPVLASSRVLVLEVRR